MHRVFTFSFLSMVCICFFFFLVVSISVFICLVLLLNWVHILDFYLHSFYVLRDDMVQMIAILTTN
jgi:hypothetical protein